VNANCFEPHQLKIIVQILGHFKRLKEVYEGLEADEIE